MSSYAVLEKAANEARGLAMDAVAACKSGHLGLPLGCADVGAVLFGKTLTYNPEDPKWLNRDRFILSAGHGSMFLYAWLHLSGYNVSLQEVKNFRVLHSVTPGHPEFGETDGVEATTGPLGQGISNAVGLAVAARMAAAKFNTPAHQIFNHHIVTLCGDGCLQEGVSAEAAAFAGHNRLDNLIVIYDSNDVTLDAMANKTQSEDTGKRFESYGFDVITIPGHDMARFEAEFERAKSTKNGRPKMIIIKTIIGKGIAEVAGTNKAHGEAGVKFIKESRKALGLPDEPFYVSEQTREFFAARKAALLEKYSQWKQLFAEWQAANPELSALLETGVHHKYAPAEELVKLIPAFSADAIATRKAGETVLQPLAKNLPLVVSGSADLHGSTLNYIKDGGDFSPSNPGGRNLYYGIREHAMGAIINGFGYYGIFRGSGATFLTFSDYLRPSIRLAALSKLPVFYIFTHDSVGVGEDGPTHQPVETTPSLRLIPGLDVIRPADPEETAAAFAAAIAHVDGPTALILSRQNLPYLGDTPVETRRNGTLRGAYIAVQEKAALELILIATGSEVHLAVAAAAQLGPGVRVVSMPCTERFDRQDAAYRESVLPRAIRKRVAIEAGVSASWYKYVGLDGAVVGIDRFGLSAPGAVVLKLLGITVENIVATAKAL